MMLLERRRASSSRDIQKILQHLIGTPRLEYWEQMPVHCCTIYTGRRRKLLLVPNPSNPRLVPWGGGHILQLSVYLKVCCQCKGDVDLKLRPGRDFLQGCEDAIYQKLLLRLRRGRKQVSLAHSMSTALIRLAGSWDIPSLLNWVSACASIHSPTDSSLT